MVSPSPLHPFSAITPRRSPISYFLAAFYLATVLAVQVAHGEMAETIPIALPEGTTNTLEIFYDEIENSRGLRFAQDVNKGSTILQFPVSMCIGLEKVKESTLVTEGFLTEKDIETLVPKNRNAPLPLFVAFLMVEKLINKATSAETNPITDTEHEKKLPYLSLVGKGADMELPIFWTKENGYGRYAMLQTVRCARQRLLQYNHEIVSGMKMLKRLGFIEEFAEKTKLNEDRITAEYKIAYSKLLSRDSITIERKICPVLASAKITTRSETKHNLFKRVEKDKRSGEVVVKIVAERDYKATEEFYMSYDMIGAETEGRIVCDEFIKTGAVTHDGKKVGKSVALVPILRKELLDLYDKVKPEDEKIAAKILSELKRIGSNRDDIAVTTKIIKSAYDMFTFDDDVEKVFIAIAAQTEEDVETLKAIRFMDSRFDMTEAHKERYEKLLLDHLQDMYLEYNIDVSEDMRQVAREVKNQLPLKGLYGQAGMRYIRGEEQRVIEMAIKKMGGIPKRKNLNLEYEEVKYEL